MKKFLIVILTAIGLFLLISILAYTIYNKPVKEQAKTIITTESTTLNYTFDDFKSLVLQGGDVNSFSIWYNHPAYMTTESFSFHVEYKNNKYGSNEYWLNQVPTLKELYHQIYMRVMVMKEYK